MQTTTNTTSITSTKVTSSDEGIATIPQYSYLQILLVYVLAAGPMALLGWVVGPVLEPLLPVADALRIGVARLTVLSIGLAWEAVLAIYIAYREEGLWNWQHLKQRIWLLTPSHPRTHRPSRKLWLWFLPFFLILGLIEATAPYFEPWFQQLPGLHVYPRYDLGSVLGSSSIQALLLGAWWFLFLFLLLGIMNAIGEELLFRGVLLPRMQGKFGRVDWVANGILMGAYHWHQPWGIPIAIISSVLVFSAAGKRFRSTKLTIALHMVQTVVIGFLVLGIVLGLA